MTTAEVIGAFRDRAHGVHLDTASYGLLPTPTIEAMRASLDQQAAGRGDWLGWEREAEVCRGLAATLLHADSLDLALVPSVAVATAMVATAVPAGGDVLVPEGDFTSVLFPLLVAERRDLLRVRAVALAELAESVTSGTELVAYSLVQSGSGELARHADIVAAARDHGARVFVDCTQAVGVLPVDVNRPPVDFLACAAYKFLCCPRGVAFFYVRRERQAEVAPLAASWFSADDRYGRFYGGPLTLAPSAAAFDLSISWHSWVGARQSLELICTVAEAERFALAHAPARALAAAAGMPAPASTILSLPVPDAERARATLDEAGVRASVRAGSVRVSAHFYNVPDDADRAVRALVPLIANEEV